jgi:hypothetical protein
MQEPYDDGRKLVQARGRCADSWSVRSRSAAGDESAMAGVTGIDLQEAGLAKRGRRPARAETVR